MTFRLKIMSGKRQIDAAGIIAIYARFYLVTGSDASGLLLFDIKNMLCDNIGIAMFDCSTRRTLVNIHERLAALDMQPGVKYIIMCQRLLRRIFYFGKSACRTSLYFVAAIIASRRHVFDCKFMLFYGYIFNFGRPANRTFLCHKT